MEENEINLAVDQTKNTYDQIAREYVSTMEYLHTQVAYPQILSLVSKFLPLSVDNNLALDIGCGGGKILEIFGQNKIKAIGIDVSFQSLLIAGQKGQKIIQASMHCLPLKDNVFNFVVSNFALNYLPLEGQAATFKEKLRILKPGGITVFSYMHPCLMRPLNDSKSNYFCCNRNLTLKVFGHEFKLYLQDWPEIVNMVINAGFELKCLVDAEVPKNLEQLAVDLKDEAMRKMLLSLKDVPYAIFIVAQKLHSKKEN